MTVYARLQNKSVAYIACERLGHARADQGPCHVLIDELSARATGPKGRCTGDIL